MSSKRCATCQQDLPLDAFYKHKQSSGGRLRHCKGCVLSEQRTQRAAKSGPKPTLRERFEQKFRVTPGCWLWTATTDEKGYGMFYTGARHERAHRVAYRLYAGEIPEGMQVCHRCDVTGCVNPEHHFLGTNAENIADREQKGRGVRPTGEHHGMAKLTAEAVRRIRADTRKQRDIAADYGVSQHTIWQVKHRKIWSHV